MAYIGRTPTNAALTAADLADGIVSTAKIAADAVTDAKIADDVVGTEHLTANEVDTTALKADAVTGAELADNAVNSEHYTDGSIDTAHLADGQVTVGKLATAVLTGATDIGAAIADADLFLVDDGAGGTLRKTAASRLKTYIGGGITGVDQWRQTANLSSNVEPISANLERNDTAGYGSIGSAMAVSSGIFTFPSTGIWRVEAVFAFYANTSSDGNMYGYIQSTQNNSTYIDQVEIHMFAAANDNGVSVSGHFLFDVTNTSNDKVRFAQKNFGNTGDLSYGNSARNMTYFTFTRLGDT